MADRLKPEPEQVDVPMGRVGIGLFLALFCIVTVTGCRDIAQAEPDTRAALRALLSAEEVTVTPKALSDMGSGVPPLLMEVAQNAEEDPLLRSRALSLLRYYPDDPRVAAFLEGMVRQKSLNPVLLRSALHSHGTVSGQKAVSALAPYLSSDDPLIREAAGRALAATKDQGAMAMVRQAAEREDDPSVKKTFRRLADQPAGETKKPSLDKGRPSPLGR
ncbi:MAG: HEAT repeat domain-containing protein [Nitrospiraceae bacterium]